MNHLVVLLHARLLHAATRPRPDGGQTTAEYALLLLGAAAIALLVVSWATRTNLIGRLFTTVMEAIEAKVS